MRDYSNTLKSERVGTASWNMPSKLDKFICDGLVIALLFFSFAITSAGRNRRGVGPGKRSNQGWPAPPSASRRRPTGQPVGTGTIVGAIAEWSVPFVGPVPFGELAIRVDTFTQPTEIK